MILCLILWLLALRPLKNRSLPADRFAHRGLHDVSAPENSLASFLRAEQKGYGIELDVRLSKCGELVVFHDRTLERMTGEGGLTADLAVGEKPRLMDTDERIPLLSEVLQVVKTPLLIELKTEKKNYNELTRRVCELLEEGTNAAVQSFDPRVLRWLKKNRPDILRGQLTRRHAMNLTLNFWTRPHFIACKFNDRNSLVMRICRRLWGAKTIYWTIKTPEDAAVALDCGEGIIFEEEKCTIS